MEIIIHLVYWMGRLEMGLRRYPTIYESLPEAFKFQYYLLCRVVRIATAPFI